MSVHVLSWVLRSSEEKLGRRLTLLVLADHAHDDGTEAWPSVETISREARLSKRQVQNCLRGLEASGSIQQTGVQPTGTRIYRVMMAADRDAEIAPPRAESDVEGAQFTTEGGAEIAPEPSKSNLPCEPTTDSARARVPAKVARKQVTPAEGDLAVAVLEEWNRQTGQRLSNGDWFVMIVGRLREHPDLDADAHAAVIAAALADPWWKGAATPSVVYGNGAQFERSLLALTETPRPEEQPRRYGRGLTTRQTAELFAGGREP